MKTTKRPGPPMAGPTKPAKVMQPKKITRGGKKP